MARHKQAQRAWDEHNAEHHTGKVRSDETKRRLDVLASYREEQKRLRAVNADLLAEGLDSVLALELGCGVMDEIFKRLEGTDYALDREFWDALCGAYDAMHTAKDNQRSAIARATGREE